LAASQPPPTSADNDDPKDNGNNGDGEDDTEPTPGASEPTPSVPLAALKPPTNTLASTNDPNASVADKESTPERRHMIRKAAGKKQLRRKETLKASKKRKPKESSLKSQKDVDNMFNWLDKTDLNRKEESHERQQVILNTSVGSMAREGMMNVINEKKKELQRI
jgi:hypothetical protein